MFFLRKKGHQHIFVQFFLLCQAGLKLVLGNFFKF